MCTSANTSRRGLTLPRTLALVAAAGALCGCVVGPNFKTPAPPKLERYASQPSRLEADGAAQTVELGRPTDAAWWRLFASPALDDLVAAGLKSSPTLASARAALEQSQDQARAGAGVFFPSLGVDGSATRARISPAQLGQGAHTSAFSLYTLTGSISYTLDLFGGERRNLEALNAAAEGQHQAEGAAYLLLTGGIVNAAIARAGYADEAKTLTDIVALDAAQRDVLKTEYQAGNGALSAELAAEQQLQADRQSLALVEQRMAASATLLQTLMGREPAEAAPAPPALDELAVPADAPVSLPSQLLRQRPDILQAEASMRQTNAQVGVATAAMFPSISLTGNYGRASLSLASLASPAAAFWSIGPSVDIPIFRGGELRYNRKAAQAAYLKSAADYRQTVLAALEQVSDALKALETDAAVSTAARSQFDAADLTRKLADANRQAGVIADYDAMSDEILADRSRLSLIAAKAQRLQDLVGLYVACGGGWNGQGSGSGALAAGPP